MKIIERTYYFSLKRDYPQRFGRMNYNQFKEYIKNNESVFYKWFKDNFVTPDQKHLKKVTPRNIQGMIVKDAIDWNGNDPDDAIVFMIGLANMADNECASTLRNPEVAEDFLNSLSDKHHEKHKHNMKALEKWKRVARESQKQFFKDQIQWLFENEGAQARFNEAMDDGINPVANTTTEAYQESAQNPSSPLRPAEQPLSRPRSEPLRPRTFRPPRPLTEDNEDENIAPQNQADQEDDEYN